MNTSRIYNNMIVHLLLIAAVVSVSYGGTFDVPFQFDDGFNIVKNPYIKNLSYFADPLNAGNEFMLFQTRYIGFFSFALNYRIHGLSVTGFHIVNILIHGINGILVYWIVRMIFTTAGISESKLIKHSGLIALLSALVFSLHPVQTQAVTYIVQRLTSMAAMFYMSSVAFYLRYRLSGSKGWYAASFAAGLLAMFTKEISFTLPFAIALVEISFFEGSAARRLKKLLPMSLLVFVIPATMMYSGSQHHGSTGDIIQSMSLQTSVGRLEYLFTQFGVLTKYIRLLLLPYGQNLDYDIPLYESFTAPQVFMPFIFLSGLLTGACYLLYRNLRGKTPMDGSLNLVAFGVIWFFMTISVESSIIPIKDIAFEHRIYLPSAGLISATVTGISMLAVRRLPGQRVATVLMSLCLAAIVIYTPLTLRRNAVWSSELSLWSDVAQKSPLKTRPISNLCMAYVNANDISTALNTCKKALKLEPKTEEAYSNLGLAYDMAGLDDKAIKTLKEGLRAYPENPTMHSIIGKLYGKAGNLNKALWHIRKAIRIDPFLSDSHNNLGLALYQSGQIDASVQSFKKAIELDPRNKEAHYNLATVSRKLGLKVETDNHMNIYNELISGQNR